MATSLQGSQTPNCQADAVSNAIGYAMHRSHYMDAVIRVYNEAGNVIETHEHKAEVKEW